MTMEGTAPKPRAVVLRGIPGAGKSAVATGLAQMAGIPRSQCVFSTDQLFDECNAGVFEPQLLGRLHQLNLTRFIDAAARGTPLLVCDNTNIEPWQYSAYVAAARALGYAVEIRLVGRPWDPAEVEQCAMRNVHGVPADMVRTMATRLAATLQEEEHDGP